MSRPRRASLAAMRRRLIIEFASDAADGAGGVTRTWSVGETVWASLRALGGRERDRADRVELEARFAARLRWRSDLDGAARLRDGARLFAIRHAADPDGRRRWLDLVLAETTQ